MLEGIRVIEMATYIAAPSAGGIMADWGADVVKVEPLGGCPMRGFFSNMAADHLTGNPVFDLDNRGKKGVAINTATPEGVEAVKKLCADADVFITNVRPGGLERSGLAYDNLKSVNPALIYASVSGYGLQGEERDRPGFDMAAFYARSGFGQLHTPKGEEPVPIRMAVGDHITGMATVSGILAALIERQRTGKGRLVEASLLRTGIYALSSDMAIQLKFGRLASTKTRHEAINPINNFFKSGDDHWFVLMPRQGSGDWKKVCEVIGRPELIEDERFADFKLRRRHAAEIVDLLDAAFAENTLAHWAKELDAHDMVWAPMQHPREVAEDRQAHEAGAFVELPERDGSGTFPSPASPIRFHGADDGPKGPAPDLGQHTEDVLRAAGYDDQGIAALKAAGTIK